MELGEALNKVVFANSDYRGRVANFLAESGSLNRRLLGHGGPFGVGLPPFSIGLGGARPVFHAAARARAPITTLCSLASDPTRFTRFRVV